MRLEEIINQHRSELNDTDMLIYKYILQHRSEARHISIHLLAKNCAVSSATIVRFAQKLGFDGFGDLKAVLKLEEGERSYYSEDVLEDLRSFYAQTTERVLKRNFDSASIYEISGHEEFTSLSKGLTPDDLFIFVSLSGETPTVVDFARQLRLLDVPFISITKLHDNTLASLSTVNLYVSPARFQLYDADDERTAFQSMLPYFMLVEVWYVKYRMYLQGKEERL